MEEYMFPCMFKKMFGIDCMGCGFQRALQLALQGNFIDAFKMFPAIYTTLLFFTLLGVYLLFKNKKLYKIVIIIAIINAIIMIIAYIYKMKFLF